jgi:hypothetical protein
MQKVLIEHALMQLLLHIKEGREDGSECFKCQSFQSREKDLFFRKEGRRNLILDNDWQKTWQEKRENIHMRVATGKKFGESSNFCSCCQPDESILTDAKSS